MSLLLGALPGEPAESKKSEETSIARKYRPMVVTETYRTTRFHVGSRRRSLSDDAVAADGWPGPVDDWWSGPAAASARPPSASSALTASACGQVRHSCSWYALSFASNSPNSRDSNHSARRGG